MLRIEAAREIAGGENDAEENKESDRWPPDSLQESAAGEGGHVHCEPCAHRQSGDEGRKNDEALNRELMPQPAWVALARERREVESDERGRENQRNSHAPHVHPFLIIAKI